MDKKDKGLERLCNVYLGLTDEEKEKVIHLAEGLLTSQKIMNDEQLKSKEKDWIKKYLICK